MQAAKSAAPGLDLALNRMCAANVSPTKPETLEYTICDHMAAEVVADAVRLLKDWGISIPEDNEIIFCDDVNCHMCQVEKLYKNRP